MLKYDLIPGQLLHEGIITEKNLWSPDSISEDVILLTHESSYWYRLRDLQLSAAEQRRIGFPLSAELLERERRIAQGTIDTCVSALKNGVGFNVAGGTHHAGSNWGEGFCMLNDQAIAANYLLNESLAKRILIVDLDVHQGNGTAEIFKDQEQVFTLSVHGEKNFPFRKEPSDLDIGLDAGATDSEYLSILKSQLSSVFDNFRPDFVFYLAGADVLETDQLGKLSLSRQGCMARDLFVFELCLKHKCPVQVSLGGGYSPKINDIVQAHCNTFKAAIQVNF